MFLLGKNMESLEVPVIGRFGWEKIVRSLLFLALLLLLLLLILLILSFKKAINEIKAWCALSNMFVGIIVF